MKDRVTPSNPDPPPTGGNLALPDPSQRADDASIVSSKDLVFQALQNRAAGAPVTDCKDLVFQSLQDCRYLIWVAGSADAVHEANPPQAPPFASSDDLQIIEWASMISVEGPR